MIRVSTHRSDMTIWLRPPEDRFWTPSGSQNCWFQWFLKTVSMLSSKYNERAGFQGCWISSTLQIQPRNIQQVDLLTPIQTQRECKRKSQKSYKSHITEDVWTQEDVKILCAWQQTCKMDTNPKPGRRKNQLGNRTELQRQAETDNTIKQQFNTWNTWIDGTRGTFVFLFMTTRLWFPLMKMRDAEEGDEDDFKESGLRSGSPYWWERRTHKDNFAWECFRLQKKLLKQQKLSPAVTDIDLCTHLLHVSDMLKLRAYFWGAEWNQQFSKRLSTRLGTYVDLCFDVCYRHMSGKRSAQVKIERNSPPNNAPSRGQSRTSLYIKLNGGGLLPSAGHARFHDCMFVKNGGVVTWPLTSVSFFPDRKRKTKQRFWLYLENVLFNISLFDISLHPKMRPLHFYQSDINEKPLTERTAHTKLFFFF